MVYALTGLALAFLWLPLAGLGRLLGTLPWS